MLQRGELKIGTLWELLRHLQYCHTLNLRVSLIYTVIQTDIYDIILILYLLNTHPEHQIQFKLSINTIKISNIIK